MLNLNQLDALYHVKCSASFYASAVLGLEALAKESPEFARQQQFTFDAVTELNGAVYNAGDAGVNDEQVAQIIREAGTETIMRRASRLTTRGVQLHESGAYDRALGAVEKHASTICCGTRT